MISKSPQRNTFQKEKYLERMAEDGRTPENDDTVRVTLEFYDSWNKEETKREEDPEWYKNNMEADLRTSDWILEKVRSSKVYAQHLYSAMCNNNFIKNDVWPILQGNTWSCSWRYAGGIIAHMRQEGDYIDWYCSGIRDSDDLRDSVPEGNITDEIREDLLQLGWLVVENNNDV